jgi:hypothetical protein
MQMVVGLQLYYVTTKIYRNPSLDSKVILQGKYTDTHVERYHKPVLTKMYTKITRPHAGRRSCSIW